MVGTHVKDCLVRGRKGRVNDDAIALIVVGVVLAAVRVRDERLAVFVHRKGVVTVPFEVVKNDLSERVELDRLVRLLPLLQRLRSLPVPTTFRVEQGVEHRAPEFDVEILMKLHLLVFKCSSAG